MDGFDVWRFLQEGGDFVRLEEAFRRPAWMADAACKERPDLPWVPPRGVRGSDLAEMRSVCEGCAVADECLAYAMTSRSYTLGIWGGLSHEQRKQLGKIAA